MARIKRITEDGLLSNFAPSPGEELARLIQSQRLVAAKAWASETLYCNEGVWNESRVKTAVVATKELNMFPTIILSFKLANQG